MKNIAIIPARSGSKGLTDKNIKQLNGKPLLAYTIEAAKSSQLFDEIFVSTDSALYAEIAREWGASTPFIRNKELSSDKASSWDVVKDALRKFSSVGKTFEVATLLQPTSPLRNANDIISGYEIFTNRNALAVVSVCEVDHSPLWCNTLPKDHSMENFLRQDLINSPRQNLPTYYRINGALYIVDVENLMTSTSIYSHRCYAHVMAKENSIDIDTIMDFKIAELLVRS